MTTAATASDDALIRARLAERQALASAAEIEAIRRELEAERAEEARLADARRQVAEARAAAVAVHAEAETLGRDVGDLLAQLVPRVQRLEQLHAQLGKQAHTEVWHITRSFGGTLRAEVDPALPIPRLAAATAYKVGKALARIGGSDGALDQIRAGQTAWDDLR